MYMRRGEGFLLVFSITSMSSLNELIELREQIIQTKGDPNFPIVLVGNKADLEEDRRVSRAKAFQLSQSWGNIPYYETSARRDSNVTEVFIDVCRQIIRKDIEKMAKSGGSGLREGKRREKDRFHRKRDRDKHRDEYDGERGSHSRCTIL